MKKILIASAVATLACAVPALATTAAKKRLNKVETPQAGAAASGSAGGAADARTR